jgi:obg-like ATPase 1
MPPSLSLSLSLSLCCQILDKPECDREEWCKEQGAPSVLSKIITTGFKAIHLIYFFTAGADEVKCWQIRKGTKAPQVRWQQASRN